MLFGICTLVMDVFKTGYYSSFFECQSAIKILHPITQAVFVIVQVSTRNVPLWGRASCLAKGSGDLSSTHSPPPRSLSNSANGIGLTVVEIT